MKSIIKIIDRQVHIIRYIIAIRLIYPQYLSIIATIDLHEIKCAGALPNQLIVKIFCCGVYTHRGVIHH